MRALVTGGAGFIGHHLVRTLLERGDEVAVIDDFSTGFRDRLAPYLDRVYLVEGEITDAPALDRAIEGCSVVFHEAAVPSVARSVRFPVQTNEINAAGTIEVMLASARSGVRRVVFAGSSSVYGDGPGLPRRETQMANPRSPYAISKLAAEHYVQVLGALHGIETVALRYFNIFGPGQDPRSEYAAVVPRWVTAALRNEPVTVYGDGSQSRDFTYIDNVIMANMLAAEKEGVSGLTCNVGCGGRYTLLALLAEIEKCVGHPIVPEFSASRPGDVPHSQADISVAVERLGYNVAVPFEEGVRRTVAAYRDIVETPERSVAARSK